MAPDDTFGLVTAVTSLTIGIVGVIVTLVVYRLRFAVSSSAPEAQAKVKAPTEQRSRKPSSLALPVVVGTLMVFGLSLAVRQTLIPPVAVLAGCSLSALFLLHTLRKNARSRAVVLGVTVTVVLSASGWLMQIAEPAVAEQVQLANQAAFENDRARENFHRLEDEVATSNRLQKQADIDLASANEARQRYESAQKSAQCEFDGTCGTGTPGTGATYQQKMRARDIALNDYEQARADSRKSTELARAAQEQAAFARQNLPDAALASERASQRASSQGPPTTAAALGRIMTESPWGLGGIVLVILAGWGAVRWVTAPKSDLTDNNG